ncbi:MULTISPECIES: aldehyde dehydrogenase [Rhodococcus]|uniref:aldehyde dehydrogenase n=1 Tax=Rhodococcus TaxID=1827 RepID=UPI00071CEA4F|nr:MULTISPECIES: aldehyde dehydrogenase [Rhodococcus]ANQ75646.1 aldehyde dehydrogenase [Rhodococcus sp. 008]KSU70633.1 aldehyde dehydrogenase [Rhodococcus qingshengii]SCC64313.1 Acyl-CoA reductase [Rhodococcus qingshengii]
MNYTRSQHFIGGKFQDSTGSDTITVVSPTTEEPIGTAPDTTSEDLDRAVYAARQALSDSTWRDISPAERATLLDRFADSIESRAQETGTVVTAENGMPISLSVVAEGQGPATTLRYYADLARNTPQESERTSADGRSTTIVRREPIGVVAAIIPWNFPQSLTMFKLAPALAAGCSVVIKPAPETVLDAFQLADAAQEAGLPPGVINVVTGGREIGAELVAHPGIDKVAFTGSTAAGRAIGEVCGRLLRPVTLELGGKSAAIVLDDADLTSVARGLSWASLLNNGQTCYLSSRILAPRSRYREVVDAVADLARSMPVGDPTDPATRVGPLVSSEQRDRVESYIATGIREGATVAAGGGRPAGLDRGWFVEPTVFADLDNSATVAREEIFGPVLAVIPYDTVDDAVAIANDSDYGLGGTVWTTDPDRGLDIARRVQTGSIGINFFNLDIGAPFGGVKSSGLGKELGPEGLNAYVSLKSVYTL